MDLLPSFRDLLQVFSAQMTAPTSRNFNQIAVGWLFSSRHTVASAVQGSGNDRTRHHSAYYRTFANASWDVDQVGWNLATKILERYHPRVSTPVEIVIDDTNATKSGPAKVGPLGLSASTSRPKQALSKAKQTITRFKFQLFSMFHAL